MTSPIMTATPAHVPAGRVVDVDIYDLPGAHDDVHAAWRRLQGEYDLVWTPRNGGHWIATGGALIMQLYRDSERFSNREVEGTRVEPNQRLTAADAITRADEYLFDRARKLCLQRCFGIGSHLASRGD